MVLLPLLLTAAAPLDYRSRAATTRRRRPLWPSHPRPPRAEPRTGINPTELPGPFPLTPEPPRALGRRVWQRRRAADPSPVFQCGGGRGLAFLPRTPSTFLYSLKKPHPFR